jgi:arsenate reductase (glutaredoxin)
MFLHNNESKNAMTVYGIKNCNTVKNALQWLDEHKVTYAFHDYKKNGITADKLHEWCGQHGWEKLLNKKGTTWRQLNPDVQSAVTSEKAAIEVMIEKPSVIKRPLVESKGKIVALGFDEESYTKIFK